MNSLAKEKGFRLIYLFIDIAHHLQKFLEEHHMEYVDFPELYLKDKNIEPSEIKHNWFIDKLHNFLKYPYFLKLLDIMPLEFLEPTTTLDNLTRLKAFRLRHARNMFIGEWGHPSKKGIRVIAKRIFEYLLRSKPFFSN